MESHAVSALDFFEEVFYTELKVKTKILNGGM